MFGVNAAWCRTSAVGMAAHSSARVPAVHSSATTLSVAACPTFLNAVSGSTHADSLCMLCPSHAQNYIDAEGNVIPDPAIDQLLAEAQDPNRPRRQRGTRKDGVGSGPVQPPPPEAAAIVAAGGSGLPGDEGRPGKQSSRSRAGSGSQHTHTASGINTSNGGKAGGRGAQAIESLAAAVVAAAQLPGPVGATEAGAGFGHLQVKPEAGYNSSSPYAMQVQQHQHQQMGAGPHSFAADGRLPAGVVSSNAHDQLQHQQPVTQVPATSGPMHLLQQQQGQPYTVTSNGSILINGQQIMLPMAQNSMVQGLGPNLVVNSQGHIVQVQTSPPGPQDHANNCGASHAQPGAQAVMVAAHAAQNPPVSPAAHHEFQQASAAGAVPSTPPAAAGAQPAPIKVSPPPVAHPQQQQQKDQGGVAHNSNTAAGPATGSNTAAADSMMEMVVRLAPCLPPGASLQCVFTGAGKVCD
jgi:hypothetical protein